MDQIRSGSSLSGGLFFLLLLGLMLLSTPVTANQTLRYQIVAGSDDAEEGDEAPGIVDLASSDLEIVEDHEGENRPQLIGLRFTDIKVAQGTPILGAYIQFTTDEDDKNTDPFDVAIYGEASDNAATFRTEPGFDLSNRQRTAAMVPWMNIAPWTQEHEAGEGQRTPDLSAIVQEIVNQPGWQSGQAMAR